jgi:hypothetical protein
VPKSNEVIFGVWGGYLKASPADEECFNTTPPKKRKSYLGSLTKVFYVQEVTLNLHSPYSYRKMRKLSL